MRYHWECGRHSGILDCCIQFFIGDWCTVIHPEIQNREAYLVLSGNAGYIRCPQCILSDVYIKLKRCECGTKEENKER
jgi:hypothetical protein